MIVMSSFVFPLAVTPPNLRAVEPPGMVKSYFVSASAAAAIVICGGFVPVSGVRVMLLPATNLMSSLPLPEPPAVSRINASLD